MRRLIAKKILMKKYLIVAGSGILNAVIPISMLLLTGMDFRYLFISATAALFISGVICRRFKLHPWLSLTLLIVPLIAGFWILVLSEVFKLAYLVLPWILSLVLGFYWKETGRNSAVRVSCLGGLIILTVFFSYWFIPQLIRSILSKELNEPSPVYEISRLDGSLVTGSDFSRKTVIIDFFGTYCKPCIRELPELEKIKEHFKNKKDIVFLIVNVDQPNDSPGKVKEFKSRYGFDFDFFYDHGGKAHKSFGLNGVPSMVIIDPDNNIRFKKEGYNISESNFRNYMITLISRISKNK